MEKESDFETTCESYDEFWPLEKIFAHHVSGVKTGCTGLLVHHDKDRLLALLKDYASESISDDTLKARYFRGQVKSGAYQRGTQRIRMANHLKRIRQENIRRYQFRPFIESNIYYSEEIMRETSGGRPRPELNLAFPANAERNKNIAIAVAQAPSQLSDTIQPFVNFLKSLPDNDLVSRGNAYIFAARFPDKNGRLATNITPPINTYLRSMGNDTEATVNALIYYCYAILSSAEYLNIFGNVIYRHLYPGFARIPLTKDASLFLLISSIGKTLAEAAFGTTPKNCSITVAGTLPGEVDKFKIKGSSIIGVIGNKEALKIQISDPYLLTYAHSGYCVIEEWLKRHTKPYLHRAFNNNDVDELRLMLGAIEKHFNIQANLSPLVSKVIKSELLKFKSEQSTLPSPLFFSDLISDEDMKENEKFVHFVPLVSLQAAATSFKEQGTSEIIGWKRVGNRKLHRDLFIAQVVGQSMEPTIPDGSFCLFRFDRGGSRNGLVVLAESRLVVDPETSQSFTVKRYKSEKEQLSGDRWRHKKIILSPDNKQFKEIILQNVNENDFHIVAEFLEVIK
jgi:hypothetical protein